MSATQPLASLGPVVDIAVQLFEVPTAAVNIVGSDEVFFAASCGAGEYDMSRDVSFCAHAILQHDVMVIEDALQDERFHDNPLVTGPAQLRFYAGVPLRSPEGHALGALYVVDSKPRSHFSHQDRARLLGLAKLVSDRLELQRLHVAGRQGVHRFERMANASSNGVICVSRSGSITIVNPTAAEMFGYAADELVGHHLEKVIPTYRKTEINVRLAQGVTPDGIETILHEDIIGRHADGSSFPVEVAWATWMDDVEPNLGLMIRNVREQRRQQDELYHLANFDPATSLPNLHHFRDQVAKERCAAVLSLGLSGFSDLSDSLGSSAGEEILQTIAERLRHGIRATDLVARTGSEEFGICLSGVGDPLRAQEVAAASIAAVGQPISVNGTEFWLQAHCGIALCPSHGTDAGELIGSANLALHEARKQEAGRSCVFVPALRMQAVARQMFDAELHQAVERDELQLYFQPQVRLSDGALTGAEALLRWNHPERGVLSPAAFLHVLEASPLATTVGNWIVDTACRNAAQWRQELDPDFRMSINLFAAQFRGGGLRTVVNDTMARYGLPGTAIELEITETTVLDDEALFLPLLEGLSEDGIQLAFDDFGTGFASLSMLARYPLTHVKIDKSFIQRAFVSDRDRAIVQAMTDLAHRLGLEVIAEGVESRPFFDFCREIGCDEAQGFMIGRPVPAHRFAASWRHWQGRVARPRARLSALS